MHICVCKYHTQYKYNYAYKCACKDINKCKHIDAQIYITRHTQKQSTTSPHKLYLLIYYSNKTFFKITARHVHKFIHRCTYTLSTLLYIWKTSASTYFHNWPYKKKNILVKHVKVEVFQIILYVYVGFLSVFTHIHAHTKKNKMHIHTHMHTR